jgi:hypothetical protein
MACLLKEQFYLHPFNPEHSQLFIQDAVEAKNEHSNSKNLIPFRTTELCDVCRNMYTNSYFLLPWNPVATVGNV